jgi:predicted phosphodiesterase
MRFSSRLAVIADVHGNARALEAVLADLRVRGVTEIVNLGDNANGPLDPAKCVALLREHATVNVRGNGDRMVGGEGEIRRSAQFARERLDAAAIAWSRELSRVYEGDGWAAFHATPTSDTDYLFEEVTPAGVRLRSAAEVAERVRGVRGELLLSGHTHVPRELRLEDGLWVVNPGSVGLPAYDDVAPFPHRMEAGSPPARYAIAEREAKGWRVEFVSVVYDWTAAANEARANGWPEWARALETGRV